MLKNITLEMSLKPFKKTDDGYIKEVCQTVFRDWFPLLEEAEEISVMLWTADGSEILDYRGKLEDSFEWCYLIGVANPHNPWNKETDPNKEDMCVRNYLYLEQPPVMTYQILKRIVKALKEEGSRIFPNKKITVGETFDPGPEFAKSSFKYERHNEICKGQEMGFNTMVCSYATLHEDGVSYAGFPDGIPEGLPFGTFLGRQSQCFLSDMGFDFLWLSNGLGFGRDALSSTGALFDGNRFDTVQLEPIKERVVDFWSLFRQECDFPIRVRGTNLSVGIDYSTDGVSLREVYRAGNILPPPNSPWAAINADFGLELMGYLSRICEIPNRDFMFRFYLHDPWWLSSPWYDRYQCQPHDIYLPMSLVRIDEQGEVFSPNYMHLLSIDNSWGDMPKNCVCESIPHFLRAIKEFPDEIPPVVWVYPFEQYARASKGEDLNEMYSADWFMRGAINQGFPLSGVISDGNFIEIDKRKLTKSILVSAVPDANSRLEHALTEYVRLGGKLLVYGTVSRASEQFLALLGLRIGEEEASGELLVNMGAEQVLINADPVLCAGGVNTFAETACSLAETEGMTIAAVKENVAWVRGLCSAEKTGSRFLRPVISETYYPAEGLMNLALKNLGIEIAYQKEWTDLPPVITISKYKNGFFFSVFSPVTTVETTLSFPMGAPVMMDVDVKVKDNSARYTFARAERRECRIFVTQKSGRVVAKETHAVMQYRRRIEVRGLEDATVIFYPEYPGE
ncbi:MAG: hypothetical protein E7399_07605, partial [Ruminococcaceae bacterium]|nr:hypothetical protein [Oscillospiraceae bacterium]